MDKSAMYGVRIDHIAKQIKLASFSGKGVNNTYGNRFVLINLFPVDAERLKALGYNVKYYDDPEESEPVPQLEVKIKYRRKNGTPVQYPPVIYSVIDGKVSEPLDEDTIAELDPFVKDGNIYDCSLVINPYFSNNHVTAYIEFAYFVVDTNRPRASASSRRVDPFADMYRNE